MQARVQRTRELREGAANGPGGVTNPHLSQMPDELRRNRLLFLISTRNSAFRRNQNCAKLILVSKLICFIVFHIFCVTLHITMFCVIVIRSSYVVTGRFKIFR